MNVTSHQAHGLSAVIVIVPDSFHNQSTTCCPVRVANCGSQPVNTWFRFKYTSTIVGSIAFTSARRHCIKLSLCVAPMISKSFNIFKLPHAQSRVISTYPGNIHGVTVIQSPMKLRKVTLVATRTPSSCTVRGVPVPPVQGQSC